MRQISKRDRDRIDLHNAKSRQKRDEELTIWAGLIRRAQRVETWIVTAILAIVMYSVVLPALQWVSKVFDTVSKVNGG